MSLGHRAGLPLRGGELVAGAGQLVEQPLPARRLGHQDAVGADREHGQAGRAQHQRRVEPVGGRPPGAGHRDDQAADQHGRGGERQHPQGRERQWHRAPAEAGRGDHQRQPARRHPGQPADRRPVRQAVPQKPAGHQQPGHRQDDQEAQIHAVHGDVAHCRTGHEHQQDGVDQPIGPSGGGQQRRSGGGRAHRSGSVGRAVRPRIIHPATSRTALRSVHRGQPAEAPPVAGAADSPVRNGTTWRCPA